MAYGQVNVNGGSRGGEFLTGDLNFVTLKTVVPCYPTNVTVPLAQALKARNWTSLAASRTIIVVDGNGASVTYDSDAEYVSAYNKQANLTTLLNVFATRANPVIVNVSAEVVNDPSAQTLFTGGVLANSVGATYNGNPAGVYTISITTERNPAWLVDSSTTESNTNGYQLLNAIDGTPVLNTTAATPAGPQDATAIAVTVATGKFVIASGSADRNIVAKLSQTLPAVA